MISPLASSYGTGLRREFRMEILGYSIGEIASTVLRCDAAKVAPGVGYKTSAMIVQVVTSGAMRFESGSEVVYVRRGQMCVRDASRQWEVSCESGTSSRLIVIPRSLIGGNAIRHSETRRYASTFKSLNRSSSLTM
ncbi:hypothetical protein [Streptomyces sp. AK08-01B]|uniref:AraC-like ligand-binding domain-containing protein n=1 Tax=unclassified Streptomyces TaxID=2593676 RepID=UPI0039F48C4C